MFSVLLQFLQITGCGSGHVLLDLITCDLWFWNKVHFAVLVCLEQGLVLTNFSEH